jgi:hypothetical protein
MPGGTGKGTGMAHDTQCLEDVEAVEQRLQARQVGVIAKRCQGLEIGQVVTRDHWHTVVLLLRRMGKAVTHPFT